MTLFWENRLAYKHSDDLHVQPGNFIDKHISYNKATDNTIKDTKSDTQCKRYKQISLFNLEFSLRYW